MDNYTLIAKDPLTVEGCDCASSGLRAIFSEAQAASLLASVQADLAKYLRDDNAKEIQGLYEYLYTASSMVTTVLSGVGWYWLYNTFDTVSTSLEGTRTGIASFLSKLVDYIEPLMFFGSLAMAYYKGAISASLLPMAVGGYIASKVALPALAGLTVGGIVGLILYGISPQSTTGDRYAQAGSPAGFVGALLALALAFASTNKVLSNATRVLTNAFKTIGVTLLAFKTFEEVLIGFFDLLPEFVTLLIVETCPSLALYIKLKSDNNLFNLIKEIGSMMGLSDRQLVYNSHNCARFVACHQTMHELMRETPAFMQLIQSTRPDIIEFLDNKYEVLRKNGVWPGERRQPFVIWLEGAPGIGKSSIVKTLADHLLYKELQGQYSGNYEDYTYFMNTSLPFMDGYHNQPITVINDYLQFNTAEEEALLIKATDTTDWYLNVSSVDNAYTGIKGEVRFTSRLIIITSNVRGLVSSRRGVISNTEAFNRRRDVCVSFKLKRECDMSEILAEGPWDYHWITFVPFNKADPFIMHKPLPDDPSRPLGPFYYFIEEKLDRFIAGFLRNFMPTAGKETLGSQLQRARRAEEEPRLLEESLWEQSKNFLKKEIFGVPLYAWSALLITGSAAYVMYRNMVKSALDRNIQSASGDESTVFVRRNFKKVRPTNKVAQSKEVNMDDFSFSIGKNMVRVVTVIPTPDKNKVSMTVFGVFITSNIILVPSHVFKRGSNQYDDTCTCDVLTVGGTLIATDISASAVHLAEEDVAFIVLPLRGLEMRKSIIHHFIKDDTIVRDLEPGVVVRYLPRSTVHTPIKVYYSENTEYYDAWGAQYSIPTWEYNTAFTVGDCGSLVMLTASDQNLRLCGMHVAGNESSGSACVITQEYLNEKVASLNSLRVAQGAVEEFWFDAEEDPEVGLEYVGCSSHIVYQNTKSDIIPSPFYGLFQEPITAPAPLRPGDPRIVGEVSPAFLALKGYGEKTVPICKSWDVKAEEVLCFIYREIGAYKLCTPELEDNINSTRFFTLDKLKLDTSPGYPHIVNRKTKHHFFKMDSKGVITPTPEGVALYQQADAALHSGEFDYVSVCSLKDERVSLEKVAKGKTRAFIIPPIEATLLVRKYFGDFIDKEITLGLKASTTVGVNPYSRDWDTFYKMMKKPYIGDVPLVHFIDGDFPSFDKKMQLEEMLSYTNMVSAFYDDEYYLERRHLMYLNNDAKIIFGRKIFKKYQGNCSGNAATTSLNSYACKRRPIICMLESLPLEKCEPDYILRNCRIVTHGDDHIIAISEDMFKYFNGTVYKNWCDAHNFGYTASIKGAEILPSKPLDQCFYLKNYFRYDPHERCWKACLKKEVIFEMVSWQHRCSNMDQEYISTAILHSAQKYAWFWGEEFFREVTALMKKAIKLRRYNIQLLTYDHIHNLYHGGTEMFSWYKNHF